MPSRKHAPECCAARSYLKCAKSAFCIICLKFIWNSPTFGNPIISQLSVPCKEHKLWWKTFLDTRSNFSSHLMDCCVFAAPVGPDLPTGEEGEQEDEVIGKNHRGISARACSNCRKVSLDADGSLLVWVDYMCQNSLINGSQRFMGQRNNMFLNQQTQFPCKKTECWQYFPVYKTDKGQTILFAV